MQHQLEHTEDRYQVVIDDCVVQQEAQLMSPATRWYTHEQSMALYREAGFADVRATIGFTFEPATGNERLWTVFGAKL